MELASTAFWFALIQIIGINIVLSGDNAVVIALAARSLPPQQQKQAILWGSGAAVVMRIVLTVVAVELLRLPYLKLVGAVLLLWIAVKLLMPEHEGEGAGKAVSSLASAVKTILIADLVMSLDNVIAVAAAAKGSLTLLIIGLAVSIPLVIFGSTMLLKLMERWPIIITIGAALLGWVAGEMAVTDPLIIEWVEANADYLHRVVPAAGAVFVVALGKWLAARALARAPAPVELGERAPAAAAAEVPALARPGLFNRILLPVDASDSAARAVEYVIAHLRSHAPEPVDIHLLNVQRGVSGDVSTFVSKESLEDYHREKSLQALERPRKLLDAAGAKYSVHMLVGKPWEVITDYATAKHCDHIVMGTRGLGSYTGGDIGSVALGVAQRSPVPVVLVK
jgi:YjbE family integral membrane protein